MAPPSAIHDERDEDHKVGNAPLEPGLSKNKARGQQSAFPGPPKFEDKYEEREYLKGRLAAAFRIFGSKGFDEGVAGHITVRVCSGPGSAIPPSILYQMIHRLRYLSNTPIPTGSCRSHHILRQSFWGRFLPDQSQRSIARKRGRRDTRPRSGQAAQHCSFHDSLCHTSSKTRRDGGLPQSQYIWQGFLHFGKEA